MVSKCALVNAFAILIAKELHHMNSKPSVLGFGDRAMLGPHEVFEKKWKLIECRGFCGASRVKNSVK